VALGAFVVVVAVWCSPAAGVPLDGRPDPRPVILLVSDGNQVLDAFFGVDTLKTLAEVRRIKPADLNDEAKYGKPARLGLYALVVFDQCAPAKKEQLPAGNTFFIGAFPPPLQPDQANEVVAPAVNKWDKDHPALRRLTGLQEVGIHKALAPKELPKDAARLIETRDGVVLLFALKRDKHTDLVMTFPLFNDKKEWNTDWPLKPSFPLFLYNVLEHLGGIASK
jgi:hypothetical protein